LQNSFNAEQFFAAGFTSVHFLFQIFLAGLHLACQTCRGQPVIRIVPTADRLRSPCYVQGLQIQVVKLYNTVAVPRLVMLYTLLAQSRTSAKKLKVPQNPVYQFFLIEF
jgi:hypothetical protein